PAWGVPRVPGRAFWTMISGLADGGAAILVTTHYREEAEQCNRLGFMVAGALVAEGTPSGVKAQQGGRVIEIATGEPQRALSVLRVTMEPWRGALFGGRLHVIVAGEAASEAERLTASLSRAGIRVEASSEEDYSLEDVFLALVARSRPAGAAA